MARGSSPALCVEPQGTWCLPTAAEAPPPMRIPPLKALQARRRGGGTRPNVITNPRCRLSITSRRASVLTAIQKWW
ncbi:hypothetical protein HNP84_007390 [Thermocatellispora tengchongensis]|uniref:Uncharacterized protein n=1 Tax=Thermocatellispora tengchongensis TaxID=1073253 RepID=A0A840PDE9_9ACTN|nr:hypothetical protein [Thermocatellispora tengchongensis]